MMRFGAMMASGVVGLVVLKLLAALMMPLLGTMVGVMMLGMKLLFWVAVGYVVYRVFFRRRCRSAEV